MEIVKWKIVDRCDFCENVAISYYCGGAKRCLSCAKEFDDKNRAERLAKLNEKHICENCNETYTGIYECPHCCMHEFDSSEGYHCLNCGTDGSEQVQSDAYDRYKDYMKYGD